MKRLALVLICLVVAGSVIAYAATRDGGEPRGSGRTPTTGPSPTTSSTPTPPPNRTLFGVMLSTKLFDIDQRVALARGLGVEYLRSSAVFVPTWDGTCPECQSIRDARMELVLTIRNSARVTQAATPPSDMDAYADTVRRIVRMFRPALVAVENEENTRNFYSGSASEYGAQLQTACQVAHDLDSACTNGGLLSGSVAFLVYQHYVDAGQIAEAESFAQRAFEPWQMNRLRSWGGPEWIETRAMEVREFLDQYQPAGADFVNFHWYVADPQALGEAVTYLQDATGLPAVTNEIGQRDLDPNTTTRVLTGARNEGLRYAVWFAIDATLARALVEPDGSLRDTGQAFRAFVRANSA